MFIGDWMGRGALYWPDRLAVVDVARGPEGRFTYAQLDARANALARFLRDELKLQRGERVGVLAHNGVEHLDVLFACARLGAIAVPYNWRLHPAELADLVRGTSPRALVHHSEFNDSARAACAAVPGMVPLHLDGEGIAGGVSFEATLSRAWPEPIRREDVSDEETLCLLFTGGTTGKSKGARISYRMTAYNTLNTLIHELRPGDVTVTHTPMFHTGGLLVYTLPLLTVGGTVVIMRRWDPEALLQLIPRERVTVFFAVPAQYQQLLTAPSFRSADLSSLRYMTSGGAPLPVQVIEAWRAVHPVPFKQGFGMTEAGPGLFSMGPEHAVSKAGSIGRPNYYVDARLVDEDGREVSVGEVGELVLKGPILFSGYFNEEATHAVDAQGWFHTGDLARRDEDGFFFIVDRKKDMFISGGENVYPTEIEAALHQHPAVHQCAVVGIPDERWGEVGCAFVVLAPGADASADGLLEHLRSRLARYKVPKKILLRTALPLSPAGKVLKRELRAEVTQGEVS